MDIKRILFFGWLCFWSGRAEAVGFRQEMDVQIGIFDAADIVLDYAATDERYVISAEVKTANLFDAVYPFIGRYESRGMQGSAARNAAERDILPEIYQTYTQSRNHIRTKKIFYDDKGFAYQRISTKDEKKNTVPINNVPESADAADLQTVFAELIHNFNQTRRCAMQREVYDGKKHYRVIIKDEGTENRYFDWLKRTENSYKCSFYIENLKENNDNILWDVSADRPIYLWVGVDAEKDVPYVAEIRIEATPLGALTVTPRSFTTTEGKLKKSEKDKENG